MSLWIYGRKEDRRRSLFSIGADPLSVIIAIAILASVALPVVQWLRSLLC
jgi:hypothetical protein